MPAASERAGAAVRGPPPRRHETVTIAWEEGPVGRGIVLAATGALGQKRADTRMRRALR